MSFRQRLRPTTTTILLPLLFLFIALFSPSTSDELQPLLNLKQYLENSNPSLFTSWAPPNGVCNFSGIVCGSDGLVSQINLSQQNLSGFLPLHAICSLPSLKKLSLGSNGLYGSLTDDLKNCTSLEQLDLGKNSFTGKVPDLSALTKLTLLSLNGSRFSGKFPWKSLENLTRLTFLSLGDNPFDQTSFPEETVRLDKLYWLYLSNCSIAGKIPDGIGNLTLLENLELSDNQLSGEIPQRISNLRKLWQLELYRNFLTGKIPVGFANLTSLVNFDSLHLFENRLEGEVPAEFGELKNLSELSLYRNKLTGALPQKLGSWAGLAYIDVSENYLTGAIPPGMCNNGKMIDFLLLQNNFTGGIPDSYANCKSLVRIRVSKNSLSGSIPAGLWSLPNVVVIDLSMNQFEGPLAPEIDALSEATSLITIQMSVNQFSGKIPETIGSLKKLSSLDLDQNMLSGTMPESLGSCFGISEINLAHNYISGEIPSSLGSLHNLNSLNLSGNRLSNEIPATLSSLKLSLLDLTNNQLIGRIPEALSIQAFNESFDGNPGLCSQNMENVRSCPFKSGTSSRPRIFLSSFIASVLVVLVLLCLFLLLKLRRSNLDHPLKSNSWTMKPYHVLSFTEKEILDSVKAENLIGKGGSGNVYKVVLSDGKELAVKHIWTTSDSGDRKSCRSSASILKKSKSGSSEYDSEVATLSSLRHVNVVKLYCSISSEDSNLLVYEYFPNGSLYDQLHTSKKMKMGWEVRYEIAVGAARGLEYLHHGSSHRPVIHRDVKSSNILLDGDWKPRIADFGLAKIMQAGVDCTQVIAGTLGYIAPEYAYTCKINEKSDVYSFGVVLMELVTGKKPVEAVFGENNDIVSWVYSKMQCDDSVLELVDTSISDDLKEDAINVLSIAVRCTAKMPVLRPSMRMVVQMLEEAEPYKLTCISTAKEVEK
ncbi:receptor-like protein kinase HAIKU2 [Pyrus ussuriensis x Pyrus communis]|uniref:non-specific serine/threonine protein kinase n=1 Tax=Pyrus ussuriensis x Pyrus communis TaxID=2448454 RepID=A0A5N5I947_9ROSA|nr:receptor-like protein kinase HAIKU2 [Pyrus ussuriensis x Pyrus communis]